MDSLEKTQPLGSSVDEEVARGEAIQAANSLEELCNSLREMGSVKGSGGTVYKSEDLIETFKKIEKLVQEFPGEDKTQQDMAEKLFHSKLFLGVTNSYGLRKKLAQLMAKEFFKAESGNTKPL